MCFPWQHPLVAESNSDLIKLVISLLMKTLLMSLAGKALHACLDAAGGAEELISVIFLSLPSLQSPCSSSAPLAVGN